MIETDVDGEELATDVDGGIDDGPVARVAWVADVASPAGPDICDSAVSVVDSVLFVNGVPATACVVVTLEAGVAYADAVVEASCCSSELVSVGPVVVTDPGIAGSAVKSLGAHATRTP